MGIEYVPETRVDSPYPGYRTSHDTRGDVSDGYPYHDATRPLLSLKRVNAHTEPKPEKEAKPKAKAPLWTRLAQRIKARIRDLKKKKVEKKELPLYIPMRLDCHDLEAFDRANGFGDRNYPGTDYPPTPQRACDCQDLVSTVERGDKFHGPFTECDFCKEMGMPPHWVRLCGLHRGMPTFA